MSSKSQTQRKYPKKIVQLSDPYVTDSSSPLQSVPDQQPPGYVPLELIGHIKEKGFSSVTSPRKRVSLPEPRATPFPVARHRSQGPDWTPVFQPLVVSEEDKDDTSAKFQSAPAEPLEIKRKGKTVTSKWKKQQSSVSMQTEVSHESGHLDRSTAEGNEERKESLQGVPLDTGCAPSKGENDRKSHIADSKISSQSGIEFSVSVEHDTSLDKMADKVSSGQACIMGMTKSDKFRDKDKVVAGKISEAGRQHPWTQSSSIYEEMERIETENRATLLSMSTAEIAEAQAELRERLRPDLLDMFMRRGMQKEKKYSQGGEVEDLDPSKFSGFVAPEIHTTAKLLPPSSSAIDNSLDLNGRVKSDCTPTSKVEEAGNTEAAENMAFTLPSTSAAPAEKAALTDQKSWTDRVEAVRALKFDLDGNVVFPDFASEEDSLKSYQWNVDNVTERDIFRTYGNPVGEGYSLKEAVALVRSLVPGQRAVALRMIALVLDKALVGFQIDQSQSNGRVVQKPDELVDWQAVWAYALGPELELVLTLRIALDDAHATVVTACGKTLQCLLSYFANEYYVNFWEALWQDDKILYTAPIFRKVTKQEEGFVDGGCWKYNVSPSQVLPFSDSSSSRENGEATVADDAAIASQDIAAGLIRMGVLPRIRYILEVEKLVLAEEHLLNVLIALSRHSPTTADAVIKCPRLIDTIGQFFLQEKERDARFWPAQVKAIQLLRVLAQAKRSNCERFVEMGVFQAAVSGLMQQTQILGSKNRSSQAPTNLCTGLVEAFRFWKVCVQYGLLSFFPDVLCFWISPPSMSEWKSLSMHRDNMVLARESYIVLEKLARTLPFLHGEKNSEHQGERTIADPEDVHSASSNWSWSAAIPLIETSLGWLSSGSISFFRQRMQELGTDNIDKGTVEKVSSGCLAALASLLHFLSTVCERITLYDDTFHIYNGIGSPSIKSKLKWLPTFVPQLGLHLLKSGIFRCIIKNTEDGPVFFPQAQTSLVGCLLGLKDTINDESVLAAMSLLKGLVRLMKVVDYLLETGKSAASPLNLTNTHEDHQANEVLKEGLVFCSRSEMLEVLAAVGSKVIRDACVLQMSESSGRGGPAPGVGVGWGCSGAGYWSTSSLKAQMNLRLCALLFEIFAWRLRVEAHTGEQSLTYLTWIINVGLSSITLAGPGDVNLVRRIFSSVILHEDTLKLLLRQTDQFLEKWLCKVDRCQGMENMVLDPQEMGKVLKQHFESVWLQRKTPKAKDKGSQQSFKGKNADQFPSLATVYEETTEYVETGPPCPYTVRETLVTEWAGQRMPLPSHWLLSPLSTCIGFVSREIGKRDQVNDYFTVYSSENGETWEGRSLDKVDKLVQWGLVLLSGLEALADKGKGNNQHLRICSVPLARKLHALSTIFLLGDDIFMYGIVRDIIGALQEMYCGLLDQPLFGPSFTQKNDADKGVKHALHCSEGEGNHLHTLDFEGIVDQRYSNFVEGLVKQFAAVSFGDLVFGRQVAIYLRKDVADSLRLKAWAALAEEHALELLPPLEQCCGGCMAYLHPPEENQEILRAYVSSWAGGALERAMDRNTISFSLSLHHIAAFLFSKDDQDGNLLLRKQFARSLVRGLIQRPQLQGLLQRLLKYDIQQVTEISFLGSLKFESLSTEKLERRSTFFQEACEGYPALNAQLKHLQGILFSCSHTD